MGEYEYEDGYEYGCEYEGLWVGTRQRCRRGQTNPQISPLTGSQLRATTRPKRRARAESSGDTTSSGASARKERWLETSNGIQSRIYPALGQMGQGTRYMDHLGTSLAAGRGHLT